MDYRKYYENYYGIVVPYDFDIHHIDFDRNNNNINNLIMLPKTIHKEYHRLLNLMPNLQNYKINWQYDNAKEFENIIKFCEIMMAIEYWKKRKNQLEILKINKGVG